MPATLVPAAAVRPMNDLVIPVILGIVMLSMLPLVPLVVAVWAWLR